jgi:hypothetical protein
VPKNSPKVAPVPGHSPKPKFNNFFTKKAENPPANEEAKPLEKTTTKYIFIPGKAEQNRASLKQISREMLFEGIHKDLLFNTVTKALSAAKEKHENLALFTIFEITIPNAKLNLQNNHYMFNLKDYITSTLNVKTNDGKVESVELPAESTKQGKNVKSKPEPSYSSMPGAASEKSQVALDDIELSPENMPSIPNSRKP